MCFSSHTTLGTPCVAEVRERLARMLQQSRLASSSPTATSSAAGRSATWGSPRSGSSPPAPRCAFSSRIVTLRCSRVATMRLPDTSSRSSTSSSRCCADSPPRAAAPSGRNWRTGSAYVRLRRHRHQLLLGIAQRREPPAEDAAGVDVDGAVEPLGLRHRRVAVHHHRRAAILRRPVVADRQPELVASRPSSRRRARSRARGRSRAPASPPSCRRAPRRAGRRPARSGSRGRR